MATLSTGLAPDPTASGRAYGQPGRVMITASLSEECFRELPFTPEAVASRILEDLRPSIHITWHEQDVIFSERAFALDRSDRTLAGWLSSAHANLTSVTEADGSVVTYGYDWSWDRSWRGTCPLRYKVEAFYRVILRPRRRMVGKRWVLMPPPIYYGMCYPFLI